MEKRMLITQSDYEKIMELVGTADTRSRTGGVAVQLKRALQKASALPPEEIGSNVLTMNSRALLREIGSGRETEITITYPHEADNMNQKVSVLSPIGAALLGCKEGDITSWHVPGGTGRFQVVKVLYQPEAEGHFAL